MENPSFLEYGVAGALTLALLKIVFDFLKPILMAKREKPEAAEAPESLDVATLQTIKENSYKILEVVNKIYEMHDIKDEDGVYIWYVKKSVADSIHKLGEAADQLVKLLKEDHG